MVDQTLDSVREVQEKNHAKRYYNNLKSDYETWLKTCPVEYEKVGMIDSPHARAVHFNITKKRIADE
jgi:hypothetical protein